MANGNVVHSDTKKNSLMLVTGALRYQSEKRQFGALMIATGLCAVIHSMGGIVTNEVAADLDPATVPFWGNFGSWCLWIIGVSSVLVGFGETVMDLGHKNVTFALIVITQLAFIPYITGMVGVAKGTLKPPESNPFIPVVYNPSPGDVRFVGAIGILSILAYGFTYVGSIAFMQFALYAFQSGKPHERDGQYFQDRLGFYSIMLTVAGFAQLMLGIYCFGLTGGMGPTTQGNVKVAMLNVHIPVITILVGSIQVINGVWGIMRGVINKCFCTHVTPNLRDDNAFTISMIFQWFIMLTLQIIVQIYFTPGLKGLAPMAPTVTAMMFGLNIMPAFLDYKMRTTPRIIDSESYYYYTCDNSREALLDMASGDYTGTRSMDIDDMYTDEDENDIEQPSLRP